MGLGTTRVGFVNRNEQRVLGGFAGSSNHASARAYALRCEMCSEEYGANGRDIHIRKCPNCQNGKAGLTGA